MRRLGIGSFALLAVAGLGCGGGASPAGPSGGGAGGATAGTGGGGTGGSAGTGGDAGTGGSGGTGGGVAGTGGGAGTGGSAGTGGAAGTGGGADASAGMDGAAGASSDARDSGSGGDGASSCEAGPCPGIARVLAGPQQTCVLLHDGSMKCWGWNGSGCLGYGNTAYIGDNELPSSVGPVSVTTTPGVTVTQIAAGNFHICALLSDGTVKCWGNGFEGRLGYGNEDFLGDNELPSSIGPVSVSTTPGVTVTKIDAAQNRTCALLSDGTVRCWGGDNLYGQLGIGNILKIGDNEAPSSVPPAAITNTPGLEVTQVAVGNDMTCALLSDGTVKCWGYPFYGALGNGDRVMNIGDNEPPSVLGPISLTSTPGVTATQIAAGDMHACALLSDGTVKCWGYGALGALGYGNGASIGDDELPSSVGPVSLTTVPGVTATRIAARGGSTCALLSNGSLVCWGHNALGKLGLGNQDNVGDNELPSSVGPVSVTSAPGVTVTQVSVGGGHTCALLSDGTVKCWGYNQWGQLGYGNYDYIGDNELPSSIGPVPVF